MKRVHFRNRKPRGAQRRATRRIFKRWELVATYFRKVCKQLDECTEQLREILPAMVGVMNVLSEQTATKGNLTDG